MIASATKTRRRIGMTRAKLTNLLKDLNACKVPNGDDAREMYRNTTTNDIAWLGLRLAGDCTCSICCRRIKVNARKIYPFSKLIGAALAYCRKHGIK